MLLVERGSLSFLEGSSPRIAMSCRPSRPRSLRNVTLLEHRHDRGIHHLSGTRKVTLRLRCWPERANRLRRPAQRIEVVIPCLQ